MASLDTRAQRRWRGHSWPAYAVVAVVALFYGPALGRYFTSEDFLLLRVLGERPPWQDLQGTFAGPWLGLTIVKFYRPVATLMLALEGHWFMPHPLPFNLVHVVIHAGNALLVAAFARSLQRRFIPGPPEARVSWMAALLFAVYPLHPNAVLFIASFATLFATLFLLGAFVLYCRYREGARPWKLGASTCLFALALGSYEAAVVLPVLLVALEVLAPPTSHDAVRSPMASAVPALLPFVGLVVGYLILRRAIFGVFVGGYDEMAAQLTSLPLRILVTHLASSVLLLVLPLFQAPFPALASSAALGLVVLAPAVLYLVTRKRLSSGHARLTLFAGVWVVAFMAPFSFVPVVPANGRYWYLVTIGAAVGLASFAGWLGAAFPRLTWAAMAGVAAVAIGWAWLLVINVGITHEAGLTARAIQGAVRQAATTDAAPRRYVTGYPLFLRNSAGVNLAQVFHYGLEDAVGPPFTPGPRIQVYPLPPLPFLAFAPLARFPEERSYVWIPGQRRLQSLTPDHALPRLAVAGPADDADASTLPVAATVVVPSAGFHHVRLIVLAAGNWHLIDSRADEGHVVRLPFPREFVRAMGQLYPRRELLWWVIIEDGAGGDVVAASDVRRLVWPRRSSRRGRRARMHARCLHRTRLASPEASSSLDSTRPEPPRSSTRSRTRSPPR
jgi:hypothetical protein